ncbi:thiamine phosphate synthase [Labilibaculum antarcticum]|uniref:Thiamine-phosphate synthase n=1 Tax=Labilibaculum antarcticum TaxID=1717717 RepID=A0A1Y1CNS2_9BACT|nr:thiamine phosphate synthase [Labilibaculum antarcticum]BAX82057.1 thiamine phosphate synthase [Labilibaculum antarcticum]
MEDFGLYIIITKAQTSYRSIAESCVERGVKMLQLREKLISDKELIRIGKEIRAITIGSDTRFVMNDRADIAAICEADFLHLGQDDMSIEEARNIVGEMKIGLSTHSIQQVQEALVQRPDYIGFGPIYPTNAKIKPDQPVGIDQLKQVLDIAAVPVVAIGGIFPENIQTILSAGAKNMAMVRHFMQTDQFDERVLEYTNLINKK